MKGSSISIREQVRATLARPVPVAADASRVGPVVSVVLAGLFAWTGPCAAAPPPPPEGLPCQYEITVVPPPPDLRDPFATVQFYDINDAGMAVGWATWDMIGAPCIWTAETGVQILPMPPGASGGTARRINNNGWILVSGSVGPGSHDRIFVYIPYQGSYGVLPLAPLHPEGNMHAGNINDHNEVVGSIQYVAEGETVMRWGGLRWSLEKGQELFLVPGWGATTCVDINDDGYIVGHVGPNTSATPGFNGVRPFVFDGKAFTVVEPWEPWIHVWFSAINNECVVAGGVSLAQSPTSPWVFGLVWNPVTREEHVISPPAPWPRLNLRAINDAGIACGIVLTNNGTPAGAAVAGTDGVSVMINDLVPPGQQVGHDAHRIAKDGTVLGEVSSNALLFRPLPSGGDLDCDALVGPADLGLLLQRWGTADPQADLNGDGTIDGADLGILLSAWSR